ncbi:hypothetical protein [Streptomyces mexicanus]|uniref:DUF1877 family protein n=1 Tax=Streptomyces mexicanus TaxID=178566 RepID=A0A7X1I782_9ACTN|nr:hypothetical protein [Streptomyces mexicanus]MBC2869616.1 hypothetical protein [Streptomyces mexicanus]
MGLDITVLIADWSWLARAPREERLERLRDAWYADETGLWDGDAPTPEGEWEWPQGPHAGSFALYEFRRTLGSFKPHFWAGERWEAVRDHVGPPLRAATDALLEGLVRCGPDGEADHVDPGFFSDDPRVSHGLLLARSPERVRELSATWERLRPRIEAMREPFTRHAGAPGGWICDFDEFTDLLADWGRVLAEAARRGWGVVGLKE